MFLKTPQVTKNFQFQNARRNQIIITTIGKNVTNFDVDKWVINREVIITHITHIIFVRLFQKFQKVKGNSLS